MRRGHWDPEETLGSWEHRGTEKEPSAGRGEGVGERTCPWSRTPAFVRAAAAANAQGTVSTPVPCGQSLCPDTTERLGWARITRHFKRFGNVALFSSCLSTSLSTLRSKSACGLHGDTQSLIKVCSPLDNTSCLSFHLCGDLRDHISRIQKELRLAQVLCSRNQGKLSLVSTDGCDCAHTHTCACHGCVMCARLLRERRRVGLTHRQANGRVRKHHKTLCRAQTDRGQTPRPSRSLAVRNGAGSPRKWDTGTAEGRPGGISCRRKLHAALCPWVSASGGPSPNCWPCA